jgi:hypothetical protein
MQFRTSVFRIFGFEFSWIPSSVRILCSEQRKDDHECAMFFHVVVGSFGRLIYQAGVELEREMGSVFQGKKWDRVD